jgi:hypothetical protein
MQTPRKARLFDLAQRSAQRNRLMELSQGTNRALHMLWNGKAISYHPETPPVIAEAYSRCSQVHKVSMSSAHVVLRKLRTSSRERAYAWLLSELVALPAGEYVASFGAASAINFDSSVCWIPDLPVTQVTSAEIVAVFRAEGALPFDQLALVGVSENASLVLDSYSEFMPEEPSPHEAVYELATFRDA